MHEVDDLKGRSVHELATIVGSLLLIIGCAEGPLRSQMKVPNDPNESKM